MAIGEKLWEGKGKSMGMMIESVESDGVVMMTTWVAQMKGMGKAKGIDGQVTFSSKVKMGPSGAGISQGQGILNTMTSEMAVIKGYGFGKPVMDKAKAVGLWTLMSMSPNLALDERCSGDCDDGRRPTVVGVHGNGLGMEVVATTKFQTNNPLVSCTGLTASEVISASFILAILA